MAGCIGLQSEPSPRAMLKDTHGQLDTICPNFNVKTIAQVVQYQLLIDKSKA